MLFPEYLLEGCSIVWEQQHRKNELPMWKAYAPSDGPKIMKNFEHAPRLFLRARSVIKFVLRAASNLENKDGEQFSMWDLDRFFIEKKPFCAKYSG